MVRRGGHGGGIGGGNGVVVVWWCCGGGGSGGSGGGEGSQRVTKDPQLAGEQRIDALDAKLALDRAVTPRGGLALEHVPLRLQIVALRTDHESERRERRLERARPEGAKWP